MDTSQPNFPEDRAQPAEQHLSPDAPQEMKASYGTLGPGSDVVIGEPNLFPSAFHNLTQTFRPIVAVAIGVLLAVFMGSVGSAHASWKHFAGLFLPSSQTSPMPPSVASLRDLDHLSPQQQAETLLELAAGNSEGAREQISRRVDGWRGKITWDSQFASLAASTLNSSDLRVREAGIEVELAAYDLTKNSSSVDSLETDAQSPDHARKVWALWALGLLANRGIQSERVTEILSAHLNDSDEDSRRWAVEGLALIGATPTVPLLLRTMHDDPSPSVRERAACSLAESGMLTHEQRFMAVPLLLTYTDDPGLDAQTHTWAFQALGDITHQHLPNDSASWRAWYASTAN